MNKENLEYKLQKEDPTWWETRPIGEENVYFCHDCKNYIVTIDVDRGTTPMFLACIKSNCTGQMKSRMYPDPRTKPEFMSAATWVWFRPESVNGIFAESLDVNEYILRGGLMLTTLNEWKITNEGNSSL